MTKEQIKKVIQAKCLNVFKGVVMPANWNLDVIANAIEQYAAQYKVQPELALAQGIMECHFGCNPAAKRSRATKNIFNVGNVDTGGNRYFSSYVSGIGAYFRLMAREYCWRTEGDTVTVEMMEKHDFRRPRGGRYATAPSYTVNVVSIAKGIRGMFAAEVSDKSLAKNEKTGSLGEPGMTGEVVKGAVRSADKNTGTGAHTAADIQTTAVADHTAVATGKADKGKK